MLNKEEKKGKFIFKTRMLESKLMECRLMKKKPSLCVCGFLVGNNIVCRNIKRHAQVTGEKTRKTPKQ